MTAALVAGACAKKDPNPNLRKSRFENCIPLLGPRKAYAYGPVKALRASSALTHEKTPVGRKVEISTDRPLRGLCLWNGLRSGGAFGVVVAMNT
jgi:hypothetical protein